MARFHPADAWIQTASGKKFHPFAPRIEDIDINDIAHALGNLCRFTGHCQKFYCVSPETRVLTIDMRWVEAGSLSLGQELLAFDEKTPVRTGGRAARRKLRPATVNHTGIIRRECFRLTLSDGTVLTSSAEHPWLVATKKSRNQVWETTQRIADAINGTHKARGRLRAGKRYMLRYMRTWKQASGYDAGYLAGLLDGEGHVTFRPSAPNGGMSTGLAQNAGEVLDAMIAGLTESGFKFSVTANPRSSVFNIVIRGGWQEQMRLLGTFRPRRLLPKLVKQLNLACRYEFPSIETLEVVRAEPIGMNDVVALETSSHTYFADGFGAHNSVAQHSTHCMEQASERAKKYALMHDAAEAYINDTAKAVKQYLMLTPHYCGEMNPVLTSKSLATAEDEIQDMINRKFNIEITEEIKQEVKAIDIKMLVTEARDLMSPLHPDWQHKEAGGYDAYPEIINPRSPTYAKYKFLKACKLVGIIDA